MEKIFGLIGMARYGVPTVQGCTSPPRDWSPSASVGMLPSRGLSIWMNQNRSKSQDDTGPLPKDYDDANVNISKAIGSNFTIFDGCYKISTHVDGLLLLY